MKRILVLASLLVACGDGRLSPQGGTITGATTNGGLVVTSGKLGLTTVCADEEILKWDDTNSLWECGTGGGFITAVTSDFSVTGTTLDLSTAVTAPGTLSVATRFGVGNDNPLGDGYVASIRNNTDEVSLQIRSSATGGRSFLVGSGADGSVAPNSFYLYDSTAGALRLRVDSSGNVSTYQNFTSGDAAGDVFDHNGDLAKFGTASGDGGTYIVHHTIGFDYDTNAESTGYINEFGYAQGYTQFRNLIIKDGKGAPICTATGSTKVLNCVGGLQVNGTSVNTFNTSNTIPKGNGTTLVASGATDDGTTFSVTRAISLGNNGDTNKTTISGPMGVRILPTATDAVRIDGSGLTYALNATGPGLFTGGFTTNGSLTSGDAAGDVFDHNGDLAKFGNSSDGAIYFADDKTINFAYATDADTTGYINWFGYNGGATRFRNLGIMDGKGAAIATFTGSSKQASFAGAVSVAGTSARFLYLSDTSTNYGVIYDSSGKIRIGGAATVGGAPAIESLEINPNAAEVTSLGSTQLGNLYTADFVGINTAPDANHQLAFAQQTGPKIALYPGDASSAFGFGIQSNQLQYFTSGNTHYHSFGYGDSDAFTERQRFDADGQVWFGDTASTAVENNLDVVTIGNTGTGQTTSGRSLISATHTGSFDTTAGGIINIGMTLAASSTNGGGGGQLTNRGLVVSASGGDNNYSIYSTAGQMYHSGVVGIGVTPDANATLRINSATTYAIRATGDTLLEGAATVTGSTQLGNLYTADYVGINTAPDANHQLTFAQQAGNKIALWATSSTQAFGWGIQANQLQHYVAESTHYHSFGYGDSDAFTEAARIDADGQVWLGVNSGKTTSTNGLDVVTIGVPSTLAATASGTVRGLTINGGDLEENSTGTHTLIYQSIDAAPTRANCESCVGTDVYGLKIEGDIASVGGSGNTALYNIYSNVTTGATFRWSGYFNTGLFQVNGASTFASTLNIQGAADFDSTIEVNGGALFTAVADFNANVNLGNSATDLTTFSNGPSGINTYDGTHFEFNEEFLQFTSPSNGINNGWHTYSISGASTAMSTAAGRPGIMTASSAASSTARFTDATGSIFDLNDNSETIWEMVVGFPTLSTASERYQFVGGFVDVLTAVNQTDGCFFAYDEGDVLTNPTTGDTGGISGDQFSIWCAQGATRTGYALDGTASEDSFTTISSAVAALTLPNTNIYRLKIVMENDAKARFYINGTEVGRITTNIPSGTSEVTGAGYLFVKSVGTTARTMSVDWWGIDFTLSAARSP